MKYRVIDYSYSNLRLMDDSGNMVVIDKDELNEIINTSILKQIKEPKHRYPHLVLDKN